MLFSCRKFFVKEHVAVLKLTDTYDILDLESQEQLGVAREEPPWWNKLLRLLVNKRMLPTTVNVYEALDQPPVLSIHKPITLIRSKVWVRDSAGVAIGYFKSKILSLGGGFWVYDTQDKLFAEIKGDWKGWNFKFMGPNGEEYGTVTKKWAGIGKELFTSADNYAISVEQMEEGQDDACMLLLAAGLSIDIIFKEK